MRLLLLLFAALMTTTANAVAVDPDITQGKTIICDLPVARTDGSPLAVGEIADVTFYSTQDPTTVDPRTWTVVGSTVECTILVDFAQLAEGVYYYSADVRDLAGRRSVKSPDELELTLKRLPPPVAPAGLGWQ